MISNLRNSGSRLRNAMLLLACAALALHAIVPAGFMVDLDEATGQLSFVICPGQASASSFGGQVDGHGAHGDSSSADTAHPPYAAPGEVCDFSAATLPPISVATTTIATWPRVGTERTTELRRAAPSSISRTATSSRGPPQDS
ncbi:MAG: hypothetical protein KJO76_03880 [Gammaproteobacteria bacterium]|nr:hypothetical protein [Gammaproteobacteria bacterium]NND37296.1 hypothetical protein [Gammaproteobacteria bacterium]